MKPRLNHNPIAISSDESDIMAAPRTPKVFSCKPNAISPSADVEVTPHSLPKAMRTISTDFKRN